MTFTLLKFGMMCFTSRTIDIRADLDMKTAIRQRLFIVFIKTYISDYFTLNHGDV